MLLFSIDADYGLNLINAIGKYYNLQQLNLLRNKKAMHIQCIADINTITALKI